MKKMFLLVLFLISFGAYAQSTWTVAGNASTFDETPFLPVWGTEMDDDQHNQLLYHGTDMLPMVDGQITKLIFYSSTQNENWGGITGEFRLMHTSATMFSIDGVDASSAMLVYTGTMAIVENLMTIVFDTPFTYTGGNLLIDIEINSVGNWVTTNFYGQPSTTAMGCRNGWPIYFYTKVTFEYYAAAVETHTITASATSGGTIEPSGVVTVGENENQRFDFTPNTGFTLSRVLIDNVENATALTNSYYIFNNVTEDHTIHAEFEEVIGTSYTIAASASTGGAITPSGNVTVSANEDKRFEFTPNHNYVLSKVWIDSVENAQALANGSYIFTNVTADHTIHAKFELIEAVPDNVFQNIQVYAFNHTIYINNAQQIPLSSIEIIDITGKKIYHSNDVPSAINLGYRKGIYIVRLASSDAVLNVKIILYD